MLIRSIYLYLGDQNVKQYLKNTTTLNIVQEWTLLDWMKFLFLTQSVLMCAFGIQIRNMKMAFNFYCTWHWVTFEKLMMKIYDFFNRLSRLITPYNIV